MGIINAVVTGVGTDGALAGMTVSSFTSVSADPPMVLFCPSRRSRTWARIAPSGRFVVNVLAADQQDVAEGALVVEPLGAGAGGEQLHVLEGAPGVQPAAGEPDARVVAARAAGLPVRDADSEQARPGDMVVCLGAGTISEVVE